MFKTDGMIPFILVVFKPVQIRDLGIGYMFLLSESFFHIHLSCLDASCSYGKRSAQTVIPGFQSSYILLESGNGCGTVE